MLHATSCGGNATADSYSVVRTPQRDSFCVNNDHGLFSDERGRYRNAGGP